MGSQEDRGMVLNLVIRMVVPMRREFGRSLDVQQFMQCVIDHVQIADSTWVRYR